VEEKKKKRKKNNLTGRLTLKFQNNMEIDKILGGVSPLKKRQSSRGGAKAGKATSTASRRGGYAKSSGARGAGGRNVGGYNRHTRFQADKWTPPPSGGDIGPVASPSAPAATAPYSGGTTNYTFGGDTDNSTNTDNSNYQVDESVNIQKSEITNPQNIEVKTTPIDTGGGTTETTTKEKKKVKKEDPCKRPGFGELCKGKKEGTQVPYKDSCGKSHVMNCSWKTTTKKKEVVKTNEGSTKAAEVKTHNQITNNVTQTMGRKRLFDEPQ
jgi:hypothetical protein